MVTAAAGALGGGAIAGETGELLDLSLQELVEYRLGTTPDPSIRMTGTSAASRALIEEKLRRAGTTPAEEVLRLTLDVNVAALRATAVEGARVGRAAAREADLLDLSLEELVEYRLTTMSRKEQRVADMAAAAYVITGEELRRAGATSIPEALRLVPGLHVAQISRNHWAISSRGFNERFSGKLLVLMDGRSIYSPLFSGVLWENQDTVLEDIERIEVIRGPGAALWGTNAMNGVINIVTRKARATQGTLLSAVAGAPERVTLAARHGGTLGDDGYYRVYSKVDRQASSPDSFTGERSNDSVRSQRLGFRMEKPVAGGEATVIGEVFRHRSGDIWEVPVLRQFGTVQNPYGSEREFHTEDLGASLLGHYSWRLGDGYEAQLQAFVDHSSTEHHGIWGTGADGVVPFLTQIGGRKKELDIDFQVRKVWGNHDLIWGVGYRYTNDQLLLPASPYQLADGADRRYTLSAFFHDDITIVPERFKLIVGSKFERDGLTGFNWQPNLRGLWTPSAADTVWAAVSRSVRSPRRTESQATIDLLATDASSFSPMVPPGMLSAMVRVQPEPGAPLKAEKSLSIEAGYRRQFSPSLAVDGTVFMNDYSDLRGARLNTAMDPLAMFAQVQRDGYLTVPGYNSSKEKARTWGAEFSMAWQVKPWWRLQAHYSHLRVNGVTPDDMLGAMQVALFENSAPRHMASLYSGMSLSNGIRFDVLARHTSGTRHALLGVGSEYAVKAYTSLDARLAWQKGRSFEVALIGKNLLRPRHTEFVNSLPYTRAHDAERAALITALWRF